MENGVFAEIAGTGVQKLTGAKDAKFRVQEKTTLWGRDALILDVVACGADEYYFVENEWDINDNEDYDTAKYSCKVGDYVKMHAPLKGEQFIMTVEADVFAAVAEGDMVTPAAGGTVAKA
jgi:hypothetical protein